MSGTNRIGNAFPTGGTTAPDTIRHALAAGLVNSIDTADDIEDINFSESGKDAVPDIVICRDTLIAYGRDPTNPADAHSPPTTLRSADGKVFKSTLAAAAFVNVIGIVAAPTGGEAAGDKYLVSSSPSGTFASYANRLVFLNGAGDWVSCIADIGQRVYVRDEAIDYQYQEDGTWAQANAVASGAIGARELAFPWGMVAASETATPPGTRAIGVTPTMPLGGTAASINDDDTATTGTTSALGDLSAAGVSGRIIAKLDLGADVALAGIEVKSLAASSGSSSSGAMGFYYATAADPSTWVQLGSGFTLSTTPTTFSRSGSFIARYVAVVTQAKDWSTATHALKALNAYKQLTSISDGVKYIVAANGIGVFSGHDTEIAEAWNGAYRFYVPYARAEIFDDSAGFKKRFNGTSGVWESASGAWFSSYSISNNASSSGTVISAANGYTYSNGTGPNTSSHSTSDSGLVGTYAAQKAGTANLRLRYSADIVITAGSSVGSADGVTAVAVFRKTGGVREVDAIDWQMFNGVSVGELSANEVRSMHVEQEFLLDAPDALSHDYEIALCHHSTNGQQRYSPSFARRHMTIEER